MGQSGRGEHGVNRQEGNHKDKILQLFIIG